MALFYTQLRRITVFEEIGTYMCNILQGYKIYIIFTDFHKTIYKIIIIIIIIIIIVY
jgi:hypothetical protein